MALKTTRWDAADYLETREDIAAYLDAVLEDGDPDLLKAALGDIARAKGMTEIARAAGLGRSNPAGTAGNGRLDRVMTGRASYMMQVTGAAGA